MIVEKVCHVPTDLFEKSGGGLKGLVLAYLWSNPSISAVGCTADMVLNIAKYSSGAISLIHDYTAVNDSEDKPTQYRMWIDPNLIALFAGNTFTSHPWETYRDLSPVARRLADYIGSHNKPCELDFAKFRQMCGSSDRNMTSWRQTVKRACAEIRRAGILQKLFYPSLSAL